MPLNTSEVKQCLVKIYEKAKTKRKELTEEDLRAYFIKIDILKQLGYNKIGEDIRLEKTIYKKGKRPDIQCLDEYGNVIFIIELKKPSDETNLKEHLPQLWDRYVVPLKARYGILTNGLKILIYERIGLNSHIILDKDMYDIDENDCQLISNRLQKPSYDMTNIKKVMEYFKTFSDPNEIRPLNTELARELFFDDFMLKEGSLFSELIHGSIKLFNYQYGTSKFLTSAYDFWLKSYAKKPDKIPESWKKLLNNFGLTTSDEDLNKFMFCLETTYALFTRLILAKACEDYKFPHINFNEFLSGIKGFRGEISLISWGILLTQWIENMRDSLVESIFEEDIFYWWTDKFSDMRTWETWKLFSANLVPNELLPFSKCVADVMFTLYKYDFSKIAGDPLGDLYQKYFDRETRKALGEFYTPKEVVSYILDAVEYKGQFITNKRLLDPACGSGTFLVDALNKYLDASKSDAEEKGWGEVLKKLCNEFHIVGFDIHPFATIMAQIHFMLILIPYYKKAIETEKTFVLRRIPIFRTDSLIDERKGKRTDILSFDEGVRDVRLKIPLPIKKEIKDKEFLEIEVVMPRSQEVWDKTDLKNIPEYFCALQAIFDAVKYQARNEKYTIDNELVERQFKEYLNEKNWKALVNFFTPYANKILDTIKDLKYKFGDGRLVKSIEDMMLAGLLKNYVKYDYVVGNPPYVRIQELDDEQKEIWDKRYTWAGGNYDIFIPFIQRGVEWLVENGKISYIVSNRFLLANYGEVLRGELPKGVNIDKILDLRDTRVFKDALNYPAIFVCTKKERDNEYFLAARVFNDPKDSGNELFNEIERNFNRLKSKKDFVLGQFSDVFYFPYKKLEPKHWCLMPYKERKIFDKIEKNSDGTLEECTESEGGFQGVSTSRDDLYVLKLIKENTNTIIVKPKGGGDPFEIERGMIRRFLFGKDVSRWKINWNEWYVIFPYKKYNRKYRLIPSKEYKEKFEYGDEYIENLYPKGWYYLKTIEGYLRKRDRGQFKKKKAQEHMWYGLSYPRSINYYDLDKFIIQVSSNKTDITFDDEKFVFTGGGTSGVYGVLPNFKKVEMYYLLSLLNSNLLEFYLKHISTIYTGKTYSYGDQFIKLLPIKIPQTQCEQKLAKQITNKTIQIISQSKLEPKVEVFPNLYLEGQKGIELNELIYTFKINHKSLDLNIMELVDGSYQITLGKKEDSTPIETKARAEYISIALTNKNVKKGEKIKILIPRDESKIKEILKEYKADKERHEKLPISKLEDEINELVYELYGLDENDKKVIEEFLMKF